MAKKDIREKKNQEAKRRFLRQAVNLGFKENDPLIKESMEAIVNIKGSSIGRDELIEQELLKLKGYLELETGKVTLTNEELQKLIDERVKEATSEIDKNNEELVEKLVKERVNKLTDEQLGEILGKLEGFSQPVYVINNYIEKESLLRKAYEATKDKAASVKDATMDAVEKVKTVTVEKAAKVKDMTVDAATKVKDTTVETASKVKDATVETVSKVKDATVETASKMKDATMETASKVKDATVETATKVKDATVETAATAAAVVITFGSDFKDNAIKQKNKQIDKVLTFFEKVKTNTKEVKGKLKDKIVEHKKKKELEKERKTLEKEKKALERERKLVEKELENAKKEKELFEKEKQTQEIESPEQQNDTLDTIFKTRLMDRAKEIAYGYGIDFEAEGMAEKVSAEIDRIRNFEDLSKNEDVIGHITGEIETLYKEHNMEIMKQKREAAKQKEQEVEQPEIEEPVVEEPEVEQPEVEQPVVEEPEIEEPEAEDIKEFLFGSEKTGFRYIEQEDGTIKRIFINSGKEQSVTIVSREEFEDRKRRYLDASNNEEVSKNKEIENTKNKDAGAEL